MRRRRTAILALFGATVFWGLSFPLNKSVSLVHEALETGESDGFVTVSTIWPRFVISTLLLLPLAGRKLLGVTRAECLQGAGLAAFMSAGLFLQMAGLRLTSASTSAFLSQCYVLLLSIAVFGRARQAPPPRFVVSAILVLIGVGILSGLDWTRFSMGRGEWLTVVSTVFFAGQILWLQRPAFRSNRVIPVTVVMFGVTAFVFVVSAFLMASSARAVVEPFGSASWVLLTLILAVLCTFGALTLMNAFQPRLNAAEAGLIYTAEPVWAALIASVFPGWVSCWTGIDYFNEALTWKLVVGGGLITLANGIVHARPLKLPTGSREVSPD